MPRKLKGKKWYALVAPNMFEEKIIGGTPVGDPKSLKGRTVDVNLVKLIDDLSKYYIKFYFKVKGVEGDKAFTEFEGMECLKDYLSRMIRYGIKKIDTVQDLKTKDGKKIRVKTMIVTSKKMKKNVKIALKKFVQKRIKEEVESKPLDEFLEGVIYDEIKKSLINEGSKIYPIRSFEIKKIERL